MRNLGKVWFKILTGKEVDHVFLGNLNWDILLKGYVKKKKAFLKYWAKGYWIYP